MMSNQTTDLQEIERLAELGRLTTSLLHDISNPITAALLYLEHYKDQPEIAANKAYGSIKTLSLYVKAARQQISKDENVSNFNVSQQISQLKRVVLPHARYCHVKLIFEIADTYTLRGNPVKFQQLLTNLIINAIESYSEIPDKNNPVRIGVVARDKHLRIEVTDHGKGIRPLELSQIFKPYYTTKNVQGNGLGIGLALVEQYVTKDFSGSICVKSSPRLGTIFTIDLPMS